MSVDYLVKAERVELMAESLYRRLSGKFGNHPRLAKVFERLASEERQHAQRIALLRNQVLGDRELAATIPHDTAALDTLLHDAEIIAQKIVVASLTAAEGVELMRQLEAHFSVAHAEVAAGDAHPSIKTFFEKMAAQDKQHAALLDDLAALAGR